MKKELIPISRVAQAIPMLRGQKVILGRDLASLYGVTVGALTQAVKRNPSRFPKDFVFQLNAGELANLKSQFVISSWGGRRALPYAFTEQGVAMLSSVLKSERARGAHASRVLVSASRRNDLPFGRRQGLNGLQSPRWQDAIANERDARATQ
jgi:ORF6N domain